MRHMTDAELSQAVIAARRALALAHETFRRLYAEQMRRERERTYDTADIHERAPWRQ